MVVEGFSINMRMVSLGLVACEAKGTHAVTAFETRANEMKESVMRTNKNPKVDVKGTAIGRANKKNGDGYILEASQSEGCMVDVN